METENRRKLFQSHYVSEDNVLGKLPDGRYQILSTQYEKEKHALAKEVEELEQAIAKYNEHSKSADRFIKLIEKYESFDELTAPMLKSAGDSEKHRDKGPARSGFAERAVHKEKDWETDLSGQGIFP